jgi:hypothetical protein
MEVSLLCFSPPLFFFSIMSSFYAAMEGSVQLP